MTLEKKLLLATGLASFLLGNTELSAQSQEIIEETVIKELPAIKDISEKALLEKFIIENADKLSSDSIETLETLIGKRDSTNLIFKETRDFGSIGRVALQHDN